MHVTAYAREEQNVALHVGMLLPIIHGDLSQPDGANRVHGEALVLADLGVLGVLGERRDAGRVPEAAGGSS